MEAISRLLYFTTLYFVPNAYANDTNSFQIDQVVTLYPQESNTRDSKLLDGIWNFRLSLPKDTTGHNQSWYKQDLFKTGDVDPMPVPSSYNDVGVDRRQREHVGVAWYDRRFHVPNSWSTKEQRIWLRFGSVHYSADVYLNGQSVMFHEIGHLPFEADVTDFLQFGTSNLLTVAVNNTLNDFTVPQGSFKDFAYGPQQRYLFDFFNYAGIHRSVILYTKPQIYIDDIITKTDILGNKGFVDYSILYKNPNKIDVQCLVQLFDKYEVPVMASQECIDQLEVQNAYLWWPYLMHPQPGYLYSLKVSLLSPDQKLIDTYTERIGIRTVSVTNTSLLINDRPIYLQGFGMHEDSEIRGRGWDPVVWIQNFNLLKWSGANTIRTSHYPYNEAIYDLADEEGIMVINESPAVSIQFFSNTALVKHKYTLSALIRRDKNHPCIIMWSIANESKNKKLSADLYTRQLVDHVKSLDRTRPITLATNVFPVKDKAVHNVDIIGLNRYFGWYENIGEIHSITDLLMLEVSTWHLMHSKPVIVMEYGADALSGFHSFPEIAWSEEYQMATLSENFKAFDQLRRAGLLIGEMVWNFADFNTLQKRNRAGANLKGIFTRSRQPKTAAFYVRERYLRLSAVSNGKQPPAPYYYVSEGNMTDENRSAYYQPCLPTSAREIVVDVARLMPSIEVMKQRGLASRAIKHDESLFVLVIIARFILLLAIAY